MKVDGLGWLFAQRLCKRAVEDMELVNQARREILLHRQADGQLVAAEKERGIEMTGWEEIIKGLKVSTGYEKDGKRDFTKYCDFREEVEKVVKTVKENTPLKLGDVLLVTHVKAIVCRIYNGSTIYYDKQLTEDVKWNTEIIGDYPELLNEEVDFFTLNADYIIIYLKEKKATDNEIKLMAGETVVKKLWK